MSTSDGNAKDTDQPTFFLDRDLGRYEVADALRGAGFIVHTLASIYGDDHEQWVENDRWIRDGAANGWCLLSKNKRIRYVDVQTTAVRESKARVFILAKQSLRGEEQVAWFLTNLPAIVAASTLEGPYIYRVYSDHIERWWP